MDMGIMNIIPELQQQYAKSILRYFGTLRVVRNVSFIDLHADMRGISVSSILKTKNVEMKPDIAPVKIIH